MRRLPIDRTNPLPRRGSGSGARRVAARLVAVVQALVLPLVLAGCWHVGPVLRASGWPHLPEDTPDPSLLITDGGFFRYTTGGDNVRVSFSPNALDPNARWTRSEPAIDRWPAWAVGDFWAPDVVSWGTGYVMMVAARMANGVHGIFALRSDRPDGGFLPVSDVPVIVDPNGAIDPEIVWYGQPFIAWSTDWGRGGRASGVTRSIRVARLDLNAGSLVPGTTRSVLLARRDWERGTVENPAFALDPGGEWWLFYSGGDFENRSYAAGFARCGRNLAELRCERQGRWTRPDLPAGGGVDAVPLFGNYVVVGHATTSFDPLVRESHISQVIWK